MIFSSFEWIFDVFVEDIIHKSENIKSLIEISIYIPSYM